MPNPATDANPASGANRAVARFLHDDVLLGTETARRLYHEVAARQPIVDVHNHLDPADIAGDRRWETITDLWLGDDHYKWKAMRLAGMPEELVTGPADPWDRFLAWATTVPRSPRNPLYLWTHLELRRVFGIDLPLSPATAREIWDETNRQLAGRWTARSMLAHFDVRAVATTDDPADDLASHRAHGRAGGGPVLVPTDDLASHRAHGRAGAVPVLVPTFRPDNAHRLLDDPAAWNTWADRLAASSGIAVTGLDSLLDALTASFDRFAAVGARASDHGLASLPDRARDPRSADAVVRAVRQGGAADDGGRELVLLEVVHLAARLAHRDDSVMQVHLGPLRNVSPRLLQAVGRDAGADVMGDERQALGLARLLGTLEADGALPRTVLFNLNPADNLLFATMSGAFSRPGVRSLVQWGPPWWFNDTEEGMRRGLDDLSQVGQLANFIGMLTDSRSILSMTRHELFRRILCDVLGADVEAGRLPADDAWLDGLVADVSVGNAVSFFGFPPDCSLPAGTR